MKFSLSARLTAEFLGTGLLSAAVVGSGIMGEGLAAGNPAVALLVSTLGTVAVLVVLILALMPVSGAHFNPAVTVALAWTGDFSWRQAPAYWAAQCTGALAGAAAAHSLFGLPLFSVATHARSGATQLGSELRRRSLVVHTLHVLCESCPDPGPLGQQHAGWDTPCGCAAVRGGATLRRACSDRSLSPPHGTEPRSGTGGSG